MRWWLPDQTPRAPTRSVGSSAYGQLAEGYCLPITEQPEVLTRLILIHCYCIDVKELRGVKKLAWQSCNMGALASPMTRRT